MSAPSSSMGYGIYFLDVLACVLFAITLALAGARFGREHTIAVSLPRAGSSQPGTSELNAPRVTLRKGADGPEVFLEQELLTLEELEARLVAAPPAALILRSEDSPMSRVIGIAHGAGVQSIRLAYQTRAPEGGAR